MLAKGMQAEAWKVLVNWELFFQLLETLLPSPYEQALSILLDDERFHRPEMSCPSQTIIDQQCIG